MIFGNYCKPAARAMGKCSLRSLAWLLAPNAVSSSHNHRELLGLRGAVHLPKKHSIRILEPPPAANVTVPIHAMKGSHHADIYIGSPPQRQTVILDTGSRIVAFPCKSKVAGNCKGCGKHVNPYFDVTKSTTHRFSKCGSCLMDGISTCSLYGNRCAMEQRYTEGSKWSGDEVEDVVWFGSADKLESVEVDMQLAVFHAFGCQSKSEGLFREQYADGILGLALDDRSIISATHKAGAIAINAFSLCLTPKGGTLSLGGTHPTEHHLEKMRMTPITRDHGLYSIEMESLEVGDVVVTSKEVKPSLLRRINNGKNGCLFDSGTTDSFLPAMFADDMAHIGMNVTGGLMDFSSAMRTRTFTFEEFLRLPDITFRFANNATLVLQSQYYMENTPIDDLTGEPQRWEKSKSLSNRLYVEEQDGAVLGANAMFGHDILFDAQEHQIGIAKAKCSSIFGK
ncbi:unnamed protein product [Cylindrotheca closterium]|uniref:Peptidase A1 domain-containing protein n=1 Tax=Cylindrotheca closterium TaxID=2856 RepID=A0AAD2CWS4_9STRA|nr:unnamed protein product [Cylindrotheca closterium]